MANARLRNTPSPHVEAKCVTALASERPRSKYAGLMLAAKGMQTAHPDLHASKQQMRRILAEAVARGRSKPKLEVRDAKHPGETRILQHNASFAIRDNNMFSRPSHPDFHVEELEYRAEDGDSSQAWVPLRIIRPKHSEGPLPAAVYLHATGGNMDQMRGRAEAGARKGYLTASIDCRYHGRRCPPGEDRRNCYEQALVRAWREGPEHPFLLDNVWDIVVLLDYLETRPDVDAARIGMTGLSLGGMHTWLAAALDDRVAAAAPMIGVQCFKWAMENDRWQARIASIPQVFAAAAEDLGCAAVDDHVVRRVWDCLLPGLLEGYDAPYSLAAIAPRPLLIANGELDPRCPIAGLEAPVMAARQAYERLGCPQHLKVHYEKGLAHAPSQGLDDAVNAWLDKHLLQTGSDSATP